MSHEESEQREHRFNNAIVFYERRREEGQANALELAIEKYSDCETELRRYAANANQIEQVCSPMRLAFTRPAMPVIDGYEHLSEIGRGGMSVVYRARQQHSKRTVAIKLIRDDLLQLGTPESRERFVDQMQVEAKATLDHPNIVRLYHVGRAGDKTFLVMEYVVGANLSEKLRSQSLGMFELVEITSQVAAALSHAHRNGILHCDIKPSNILIDDEVGFAKLADFGLAVAKNSEALAADEYHLTGGTSGYLAPELVTNPSRVPAVSSDIYSFGVTLFESLTGVLPSSGAENPERRTRRNPKSLNPNVPNALDRLCERCLNPEPKQRFSSMEEVHLKLNELLTDSNAAQLFVRMGWLLIGFGMFVAIVHAGLAMSTALKLGEPVIWLLFFLPYGVLFSVFRLTKLPSRLGSVRAQRELWTIWIGHLGAAGLVVCFTRIQSDNLQEALETIYPLYGVITALCAWIMGASFWKGHFALAGIWAIASALMIVWPAAAPVVFGVAGLFASIVIGSYELHLRTERSLDRPLRYSSKESNHHRQHSLLSVDWSASPSRTISE